MGVDESEARSPSTDSARLDRLPCGYVETAADGTITEANDAFVVLTGRSRAELLGGRFADLLSGGGRIYLETHYLPMLHAHGRVDEIAFDLVTPDGARRPVLVNATLDRAGTGEPLAIRAIVFGATERRHYERELLQAKERAEASERRAKTLVRTLQQTLLPPAIPTMEGLDVAATYRPAGAGDDVGGDFYDIFEQAADEWIVAVGDVTGKGVDAAMVTALARHTIRAAATRSADLRRILTTLNDVLRREDGDDFCTVALARIARRAGAWQVETCHGGHPLTLLVQADGAVGELGEPGTLLGVEDDPVFAVVATTLHDGDAIVLYTDGISEGRRGRELFGEERTGASVARHRGSARRLTDGLLDDVLRFQGGVSSDDIVVVAVRAPVRQL